MKFTPFVLVFLFAASGASFVHASGVGAEWTAPGVNKASVLYDAGAPTSNFGAPTNADNAVAYDIYSRSDASYVYFLFQQTPEAGGASANVPGTFANLYVSTYLPGNSSTLGFELTNHDAFIPGVTTPPNPVSSLIETNVASDGSSIEAIIPWSFFTTDPLHLGFTKITATNDVLQLRLSQSFSYSVAGGASYGDNRLGELTYRPTPDRNSTIALLSGALIGLFAFNRYSKNRNAVSSAH